MNNVLTIILSGVILCLIILAVVIRFKSKPSAYDKEEAEKFLKGLSETFYNKMLSIVSTVDINSFSSLEDLEVSILNEIYDVIWDYVEEELEEASKSDIITAMVLKVLNKNFVIKFVDKLIEEYKINDNLCSKWNKKLESASETIEAEDKDLQEKFSNSEEFIEEFSENDLKEAENVEPTAEDLASIIPPSDEEKEYNPEEDESVELIDDEIYIDANGRKRDKKTGRFVW